MNNSDFQALLHQASRFSDRASETRYKEMLKYLDDTVKDSFQITFGNRIANQLDKFVPVYIACGGTVDEAIDIMFSRKVLRKLEGLYDENTKENLDLFKDDNLYVFSNNLSRLLPIFPVLQRQRRKAKIWSNRR